MKDKYLFSLLEDPRYYDGENIFVAEERNFFTEEEIKNKKMIINNYCYPIYTLNEISEIMKNNNNYVFYDSVLDMVDNEWKQKILDSGIKITKSV